ncbi:MAG TPA: iron ABC transporter permease [Methylomirabilota bacterium]|jgi:iron(III) transport system permease protein|nr:iron ABC transporter permease [Methylomirabilota bacterium]
MRHAAPAWWAGLGLAAFALAPWARGVSGWPGSTGLALAGRTWAAVGIGLALLAGLGLGLGPWGRVQAGRILVAAGGVGSALALGLVFARGEPFGAGALLSTLSLLTLAGLGLGQAGLVRGGGFVGAAILGASLLVGLFVVYPLAAVLHASVAVGGRLTTGPLVKTVTSPVFLLLAHEALPVAPGVVALAGAVLGLALGSAPVLAGRRPTGAAIRRLVLLVGGGALVGLLLGARGALRNSLLLAGAVGVASTALGLAFALLDARSRLPTRRWLAPLSALPIITPAFVLGLAFIYLFGRRGSVTHGLLGLDTGAFFGPLGVAVAQVMAFTPIAFLVLAGVVRSLDAALEEAAQTLRATPGALLRTVTWPLLRPGLANALLLVMIESLADFGNPLLLGGGVPFLSTEVFLAIEGRFDPHEAAVYGLVLLTLVLALFLLQRRWLGDVSFVTITGRPSGGRPVPLPRALDAGLTGLFVVYAALAMLLYGSLFLGGFVRVWGIDHRFTLDHYRGLATAGLPVLLETARLAAVAAIPAALLGFLIAYLTTRHRFAGRTALEFSALLSYAAPGTVMGIGYILAFNQGGLRLTGTAAILVLAFMFRGMPVGIRSGMAALAQIDRTLEEASSLLRADVPATLRRVLVPLVLPALVTGLLYCFIRAMTGVSQVIFLVSPGHDLATVLILSWAEYGHLGRGAALASLLVLFLAAVLLPAERLGRRRRLPSVAAGGG